MQDHDAERERRCRLGSGTRAIRKLAHYSRNRRLRRKTRDQLFDLAFRFAGRLRQYVAVVVGGQVRASERSPARRTCPERTASTIIGMCCAARETMIRL